MRTEYAKYKDYKKANVKFIDVIPSHWEIWKVTHGYRKIGSGTTPKSDNPEFYSGDIPWITTSELRETIINDSAQKITEHALENVSSLKLYNPGSVAIAMYGATIGRLGILGIKSTVNQACCVFDNPENFHQKFLFYWLWMSRNTLIAFSAGGGQPNLSQDDLKQLRIPIPEIPEQTQIANFLDKKTAQIDKLINEKEKLLKLLAEKRTAIITQAVTKGLPAEERAKAGLDPNVEMKDSGIDWLGGIPKDWEVKKFKYEIDFQEGPGIMAVDFELEGVPLLRIRNIKLDGVDLTDCNFLNPDKVEEVWKNYRLKEDDLLISTSATTGLVSHVTKEAVDSIAYTGIIRLRPIDENRIDKDFIRLIVSSELFFNQIDLLKTGSTIQHYGPYHLRQMIILRPPIEEQKKIHVQTTKKVADLDNTLSLTNKSINQLKEYREALITAAVTGQIDVRKEVINE